ncbi:MAG: hypothetical protein NZ562_04025, partial [Thermomicrobium sp.]|nr:hypothetical protein [Thermomicrobium sp.]
TADRLLRVDYGPVTTFKNNVRTYIVAQTVDENGVQLPAQQLLVSGPPGLTIAPAVANTTMFGVAVIELWGINIAGNVTVCWDLNTNGNCNPGEPQVAQSMSWGP